ncbi:unnamed protein product, partial [Mesorhabditis spiculigera]
VISHSVDRLETERLSWAELSDVKELLPIANIPSGKLDDFTQRLRETVEFYLSYRPGLSRFPSRLGVTSGFVWDTGSMNTTGSRRTMTACPAC